MKYLSDSPGHMRDFIAFIKNNQLKMVKTLLKSKEVDANCAIYDTQERYNTALKPDYTPLTIAANYCSDIKIIKCLMDSGADVNTQTNFYFSALYRSITTLNKRLLNLLLQKNATDPSLFTPHIDNPLRKLEYLYTTKKFSSGHFCFIQRPATSGYNRTLTTIISIARKLIAHGANTDLLSDPEFLKKINESAITPATPQLPIQDLTTLSSAAALAILEGSDDNSTLNTQTSNFEVTRPCSNHTQQNLTVNGTLGGNNTFVPSKECINMNRLVGSINSTAWKWGDVLGVAAGIVVLTGVLGGVVCYVKNQYQQHRNYQKSAV